MIIGRGSWIRTNDLQYPKLPRYQAALYPDIHRIACRYTLKTLASSSVRGGESDVKARAKPRLRPQIGASRSVFNTIHRS
jgi:hypothetical protein